MSADNVTALCPPIRREGDDARQGELAVAAGYLRKVMDDLTIFSAA